MDEPRPAVDVTLIDEHLRLTPEQRLVLNDRLLQTVQELRDAIAHSSEPDHDPAQAVRRGG